jgi:hypothetical protein
VSPTPWDRGKPQTFHDLFIFYHDYVKPLYSAVQAYDTLPVETLFELNAAFDHTSRHWVYDEEESCVVDRVFGHLKRSCLDIYKLKVEETRSQYDELMKLDTSVLEAGRYDKNLRTLFLKMKRGATDARCLEGCPDDDHAVPAFELWEKVYVDCWILEDEFFMHPDLDWAKKQAIKRHVLDWSVGFVLGIVSSLIAWYVTQA